MTELPKAIPSPHPTSSTASGRSRWRPAAGESSATFASAAGKTHDFSTSPSTVELPPAARLGKHLESVIRRLPGASVLLLDEIASELSLTESQKEQIRQLCDASAEAVQQIDGLRPGTSRHVRSQAREAVLEEAQRRALELLTPQQRARWNGLQSDE